jgi:hypothetical protein
MSIENVPEGGWPTVPVLAPYETPDVPEFETGVVDPTDEEAVDEVLQFYIDSLIPQLACSPDGTLSPHPQKGWVMSTQQPKTIVVCRVDGQLQGAWIMKENGQIFYPCATVEFIAAIFRALWDETIKHFDYVWGDTRNPVIMAFAQKAVRIPRSPNSPTVNDERLEWRRS